MGDYQQQIEQGLAALKARDPANAARYLSEASKTAPPSDMPWIALGNAQLSLGRNGEAETAIDAQLELAPRDVGALLLKGWLREQANDTRAAVSFYRAALNQAAISGTPPALQQLHGHAAVYAEQANDGFESHLLAALGTDLSPVMTEALELLTGRRQLFLQEPSLFYYPGLPQKRFYDPADFPWLEQMLALLPEMQAELHSVMTEGANGFAPYVHRAPNRPAPNNPLLDNEAWTAFHFWRDGDVVAENAMRCPATMKALSHAPMPQIAGRSPNAHWSRLLPGAHITPHTGMLNTRLICHIPIKTAPHCWLRVGSETRGWEEGQPLLFDDSINHEAKNEGDQERVVLLFEIWRPEIDAADREAIGRIFQAIGEFQ